MPLIVEWKQICLVCTLGRLIGNHKAFVGNLLLFPWWNYSNQTRRETYVASLCCLNGTWLSITGGLQGIVGRTFEGFVDSSGLILLRSLSTLITATVLLRSELQLILGTNN